MSRWDVFRDYRGLAAGVASSVRVSPWGRAFDRDDLVSEAYVALLTAIDAWPNPTLDRFATYARNCVFRHVTTFASEWSGPIRVPRRANPNDRAGVPSRVPLDDPPAPTTGPDAVDNADAVGAVLDALDRRAAEILTLRYGLDGGPEMTLAEVGSRVGYTRQRVWQIECEAFAVARKTLGD